MQPPLSVNIYDESDASTRFTNFYHQRKAFGGRAQLGKMVVTVAALARSLQTTPKQILDPLRVAVAKTFLASERVLSGSASSPVQTTQASSGWHLFGIDAMAYTLDMNPQTFTVTPTIIITLPCIMHSGTQHTIGTTLAV